MTGAGGQCGAGTAQVHRQPGGAWVVGTVHQCTQEAAASILIGCTGCGYTETFPACRSCAHIVTAATNEAMPCAGCGKPLGTAVIA